MNADRLLQHFERISEAPDAVPRLRRFILDLAVRGKLVEQDPGDEPAAKLLERIRVEKERLMKAGEIRQRKLPKPADSGADGIDLPGSWEWASIRQITTDHGQKIPDVEFTYIDVSAINKEIGEIADPQVLAPDAAPSRARKIVRRDDVIYSCVRPYLLNIAVVGPDIYPEPIASTAFAILNGMGFVEPRYLWAVLRSPWFVSAVEDKMRGQAYPAINDRDFAPLPVPVPPLAEQHRIVAKVDELMALCDELEAAQTTREKRRDRLVAATLHRLNNGDTDTESGPTFKQTASFYFNHLPRLTNRPEHIQQLRQTILNLAVRGRLVAQDAGDEGAEELLQRLMAAKKSLVAKGLLKRPAKGTETVIADPPFPVPNGWIWVRWESVALRIGDIDHKMPEVAAEGVPYVSPRDFRPGNRIDFDGAKTVSQEDFNRLAAKIKPDRGDIIYPRYGTIGENRLVEEQRDFLASYSCAVVKVMTGFIDPQFQFIYSISPLTQSQALNAANKATQPNVGIKSIKAFSFPLPPLREQRRIAAKVGELMAFCDELNLEIAGATGLSRSFLGLVLTRTLASDNGILEGETCLG